MRRLTMSLMATEVEATLLKGTLAWKLLIFLRRGTLETSRKR